MGGLRLSMSQINKNIFAGKLTEYGVFSAETKTDVNEDFKRCVVLYCSEVVEFEVDGMRFRATCERID